MPLNVLFAARPERWDAYAKPLKSALETAGLMVHLARDMPPQEVDYIIYAPGGPVRDFTPYTRARAVLGLWAGVEGIVNNPTLTQPLTRMVDEGLSVGMAEWVTGHVMRHHLGIDQDILRAPGDWTPHIPPLARERPVTILGMGQLGQAAARMLSCLGFPVSGWSRTPKALDSVTCHAGAAGLKEALAKAQILVLLLPDTPATRNILDARRLAMLPRGAVVLNPGRGTLIDE